MTTTSFARGVNKQLIIGPESTYGTPGSASGGQLLPRVNAALALNKDQIRSNEIRPSMQLNDMRHGVRRGQIPFSGQMKPSAYKMFFEAMLRRAFAAGATTGTITTVTAAAGPPGTFTRSAGSFLTDGFKIGDVVRWTGFTTGGTANNARNYRISALTATVMTVSGVGNEVVAARTSGDSVTCAVVGKKTFIPATSQLFNSYTWEQLYTDTSPVLSERYVGSVIQSMRIALPASGMWMLDTQWVSQDVQYGSAGYFTSPTAMPSYSSLTGVSGVLRLNGVDVGLVTSGMLNIVAPIDSNAVVGKNIVPYVFSGMITVDGQLTIMLTDNAYISLFDSEQECDLHFYGTCDGTVNSDFVAFVMNRIKVYSLQKSDGDRSIIQAVAFQALEHVTGSGTGTAYETTTFTVQDSTL